MEQPEDNFVEDAPGIKRFEDGSVIVGDDEQGAFPDQMQPNRHDENLALILHESELRDIGSSLKLAVEDDIESQSEFYEAVSNIIKFMGIDLSSEANKEDLPFKGASSVYSSALFESVLDIVASAKGALFPSSGMVDTVILGEASDELQNLAYRKKAFNNYYFDTIATEFRKEAIRTIFWAALAGSAYKKVYNCPVLGRPVSNFIPIEDFIVNRAHSSHLAASRKTHILRIDSREFQIRVMTNFYRDIRILNQDMSRDTENSAIRDELDKLSGIDSSTSRLDQRGYVIYECHVDYRIKGDPEGAQYDIPLPYIISVDEQSGRVLSIRRNWQRNDFLKKKREFFVNYSLLPSLDGEGYGFANYAGRASEAATSLTRQLINAGTYANFPGGIYQAGIRLENNNLRPAPGEFVPITTGGGPLANAIEALPYKEPSPALRELKNEIEDSIRKPSAIINQKVSEMAPRAPMGSVLAMLENLQKVPNAILQNFHESFTRELELFNDRFAEWLPANQPYPFVVPGGEHVIMRKDFEANVNVFPASDPSTQNAAHRFLLSEIVVNNAKAAPDVHNMKAVFQYFYKKLGLSEEDIQQLLSPKEAPPEPPQPMDPVTTIMALTKGEPVNAAVWQDHAAYISIIDAWMQSNPQSPNLPAAAAYKAQHEALKYMVDTYANLGMQPPADPSQLTPDEQNQLAVAVAQLKAQEAQAAAAQAGPPPEPPMDPAKVELEIGQLEAQMSHEKNEIEMRRLELDSQKIQMEYELKEREFALKSQLQSVKQQLDEQKAQLDYMKIESEQSIKDRDQALKERDQALKENLELRQEIPQQEEPQQEEYV